MKQWRWVRACLAAMLVAVILVGCGPSPTPTPAPMAETSTRAAAVVTTLVPPSETPTAVASPAPSSTRAEPATAVPTVAPTSTPEDTATASPSPPPAPPTALPTTTAVPADTATSEPTGTTAAGPRILTFQVTPSVTTHVGDGLTMTWQAVGDRAELCPVAALGPVEADCRSVPLSGSLSWTTDEEAMGYTGFALRVGLGAAQTLSVVDVKLQCQNLRPWFFINPPQNCPAAEATISAAAGQYFERGLMIWTDEPDTFYVFYRGEDESGFQTFDWIREPGSALKPGASPDNRVGEAPPDGLFEPVSGFGMVWRGEVEGVRADVRQRLGWATEPEFAFESAHQCMTLSVMRYWVCFLRGPRGEILRLHPDSTAQVRFVWEEW